MAYRPIIYYKICILHKIESILVNNWIVINEEQMFTLHMCKLQSSCMMNMFHG